MTQAGQIPYNDKEHREIFQALAQATPPSEDNCLYAHDWMSGIGGDRYLYDFNIPGTHDSGCWSVWARSALAKQNEKRAITQSLTIVFGNPAVRPALDQLH